jgi:hypothetical protein
VSFASFPVILCLFLIYISVVWRARWDERSALHDSSAFHYFCQWGVIAWLGITRWVLPHFSWSCAYFQSIYLSFEGPNETRGLRFTIPPHFTFLPMRCYSMARHNSVSSASFFMVLCLFLIYVSVVWRARWDERSAIHRSSTFHIFVMGVLKHSYGTTWWALLCYSWSCAYFWPIYLLFEGPNEMRTYPFLASSQTWFSTNFRSLCLLITYEITSNCRLDYQCLHRCFFKTHS